MISLHKPGKFIRNPLTRHDRVGHDAFVHIEHPLILGDIAHVMAFVQHAPYVWPQSERMRQHLEHDVTVTGAITLTT